MLTAGEGIALAVALLIVIIACVWLVVLVTTERGFRSRKPARKDTKLAKLTVDPIYVASSKRWKVTFDCYEVDADTARREEALLTRNKGLVVTSEPAAPPTQSIFGGGGGGVQVYVGFGLNYSGPNTLLTCWNDLQAHYSWWRKSVCDGTRTAKWFLFSDKKTPYVDPVTSKPVTAAPATIPNWRKVCSEIVRLSAEQPVEVVFYFSGHGYKRSTWDPDELDGQSECIVMQDSSFYWDYMLVDEFLRPLPATARVFAIFDSCHSGTVMNPRHTYNPLSKSSYQTSKNDLRASLFVISGCQDSQTSSSGATSRDMSVLTRALLSNPNGILPKLRTSGSATFVDLYTEVRATLRSMREKQLPEFACSHPVLFHLPFFQ